MVADLPPPPPSRVVHVVATPPLALAIQAAVRDGLNDLTTTGMLTIHQGSAAEFFPALSREMYERMPKYTGTKIPGDEQRAHMEKALQHYAQTAPAMVMGFLEAQQREGRLSFAAGRKENVRVLIENVCQEALQRHEKTTTIA